MSFLSNVLRAIGGLFSGLFGALRGAASPSGRAAILKALADAQDVVNRFGETLAQLEAEKLSGIISADREAKLDKEMARVRSQLERANRELARLEGMLRLLNLAIEAASPKDEK